MSAVTDRPGQQPDRPAPPARGRAAATGTVPPGRFRRRLTVAFVLVAGIAAALLAVGSYLLVRQARLADSLDQAGTELRYQLVLAGQFLPLDDARSAELLNSFEGSGQHVLLATGASGGGPSGTPAGPGSAPGPGFTAPAGGLAAAAGAGAPVPSNPDVNPGLAPRLRSLVGAGQLGYERSADRLIVGGRIPGSAAELYVVHPEDRIRRDLAQLRYALLAGWLLVLVLAAAVGHALARRTLEPVGRASRAARAIAEGLLSTRLPVTGRDEFGAWALSFNQMADALQDQLAALAAAQRRERRFTSDVAHELRTPVTALVGAAALLRDRLDELPDELRRPAQLLAGDAVRLRRLVEDLMEISRLDAGREPVAASPVDLLAAVTALVAARGWTDRVRVTGRPTVRHTDPRRLERVLANLVANAVEHGGRDVVVTVEGAGPGATVTVADGGPGIPAEHLPHLFDRFYKADPARTGPGSGLGLAIARENARLLGATLTLDSRPGAGTRARVDLPPAPPALPVPPGPPASAALSASPAPTAPDSPAPSDPAGSSNPAGSPGRPARPADSAGGSGA
ncbi:ATP-binding protein [Plantactinospora siamensis]|uniref:histidine kinase n=1 Tax=Plantactinospora siamensis TaxID=555372 RepID=A0ABV6NUZ7_9ACTN